MSDIGLPATLAGFEDDASFKLSIDRQTLAILTSRWTRDGRVEGRSTLSMAGQRVETHVSIIPDSGGIWREIIVRAPIGVHHIARIGSSIRTSFRDASSEKVSTFDSPPGAVLFENDCPVLISQALRAYDRERGGKQAFPLIIRGRTPVELTLEARDHALRVVSGRPLALTTFLYSIPGVDLEVLAGESGQVYLVRVPAQRATMVRAGFEQLLTTESHENLYDVAIERGVGIPMRDGIHLATDIYRPKGLETAPALLFRTPYKKELLELHAMFYARRGYVFAAQDCRGRFASPGVWEPFVNEGRDGYDAIEWLAAQPFSTGKIGTIGGSYAASAQWLAAAARPPHLCCMVANVSPPDPFYNVPYEYGVFFLWAAIWWSEVVESGAAADLSGAGLHSIRRRKYRTLLRSLPVIDLDKAVFGTENPRWRKWIAHPVEDEYWQACSFLHKLAGVNLPALHQSAGSMATVSEAN